MGLTRQRLTGEVPAAREGNSLCCFGNTAIAVAALAATAAFAASADASCAVANIVPDFRPASLCHRCRATLL